MISSKVSIMQYIVYIYVKNTTKKQCLIMPGTGGLFPAEIIVEVKTAAISTYGPVGATGKVRLTTINVRVTVSIN